MESSHKSNSGLKRIWRASFYSADGFRAAIRHEHAFRQELFLCAVLLPFAILLPLISLERAILIASLLLMLIVELLNSAIEAVVDCRNGWYLERGKFSLLPLLLQRLD